MPAQLRKLGAKLTLIAIIYLALAVAAIGVTLLASWQLEGGAAAINQLGSQRMRSWHVASLLALQLTQPSQRERLAQQATDTMSTFQRTMTELRNGDPARPMFLPRDRDLEREFDTVAAIWRDEMAPRARLLLQHPDADGVQRYHERTAAFVQRIDELVLSVEHDLANSTALLRSLQLGLIALSVAGALGLIGLMFLLVVRPLLRLQEGIQHMQNGDFDVRLPVETRDEFGDLAMGFNQMAQTLAELYRTLEQRVSDKTRSLAEKNDELALLYEMTSLLNEPGTSDEVTQAFLARVTARLGAAAASVRLLESESGQLHLVASCELNEELATDERCMNSGECVCGEAAQNRMSGVFAITPEHLRCTRAGYRSLAVFPITANKRTLGVYNLLFDTPRQITARERHMLETLGQHLGVAIENQRLAARERQAAVYEERNLLAQELHDSIAQSLAFLNIQAQLLTSSLAHGQAEQATQELACIREGIQQSCDDVRELLLHFRARPQRADLAEAITASLKRFQEHTGIQATCEMRGSGMPLDPDLQVQALHIIQECLSNVRKHAHAAHVHVVMERGPRWQFEIQDDGCGFDPSAAQSEEHVGLHIMRERARRIGGELHIESGPGRGTRVCLRVGTAQREAA